MGSSQNQGLFWLHTYIILRHLIFKGVPKWDPNFGKYPYITAITPSHGPRTPLSGAKAGEDAGEAQEGLWRNREGLLAALLFKPKPQTLNPTPHPMILNPATPSNPCKRGARIP